MRGYESSARIRPAWAAATAASPEILSSRRAFAITGPCRRFLHGGGSFWPRPAIACCAQAARDTSQTTRASHPPQVPRCARKDPRISLPVPCPYRSGNPRLLLLCRLISGEFVRLTPVPSVVLPPRRSRLPAGRMPLGLPLLFRSLSLLSLKKRSPSAFRAPSIPSAWLCLSRSMPGSVERAGEHHLFRPVRRTRRRYVVLSVRVATQLP